MWRIMRVSFELHKRSLRSCFYMRFIGTDMLKHSYRASSTSLHQLSKTSFHALLPSLRHSLQIKVSCKKATTLAAFK